MLISLITDEYSQDPVTAFELGRRWGVEHYEIRQAYRFRVPVAPVWAADRVVAAARDFAVKITAISPGLFKPTMRVDGSAVPISQDDPAGIRRHLDELLPQFFSFAERLGTRNIVVFALPRPGGAAGGPPPVVIETLAEAAAKARQRGFQLMLETGAGSWAYDGPVIKTILEKVNSPALRLTWDPANISVRRPSDDPVGKDYAAVKPFVHNVHIKDVAFEGDKGEWTMLGDGVVDWPQQFRLLRQDGYAGALTLEPHLQYRAGVVNLVAMMEEYLDRLRGMLGRADINVRE